MVTSPSITRSARERAIVAHMTPDERRGYEELSWRAGAVPGLIISGAMGILMLALFYNGSCSEKFSTSILTFLRRRTVGWTVVVTSGCRGVIGSPYV